MDPSNRSWVLPLEVGGQLEFTADAAVLRVMPMRQGEQPRLEATSSIAPNIRVEVAQEGQQVRVRAALFSGGMGWDSVFPWNWGPNAKLTLYVPQAVRARVKVDYGRVRIERLEGCELDVATDAGEVTLEDIRGKLKLRTSAGQVVGERLSGSFDVEATVGAVRLAIGGLDAGKHRVRSSMGSVRLDLARGLKVRVDMRTSLGHARSTYPSSPDAAAVLDIATDVGSVRVDETSGRRFDEVPSEPARPTPSAAPSPSSPPSPEAKSNPESWATNGLPADEEVRRVLAMVQQGSISIAEAEKLLKAMGR